MIKDLLFGSIILMSGIAVIKVIIDEIREWIQRRRNHQKLVRIGEEFTEKFIRKIPQQYAFVRFDFEVLKNIDPKYHQEFKDLFWDKEKDKPKDLIFFGDIPNMLGHCIVADHKTGKFEFCFHTDYFIELTEDEI